MRVTQRTMYSNHITNMNKTLNAYMESNLQGSSQKKINRPSDDPAGMALVLNTRNDIAKSSQYEANADTAEGWITLAESTLGSSVSTTITAIKTLAEQAATGTMTEANRKQNASQLRELFGTLLNLSNTQFGDKSLFAGHKYNESAFDEVLAVTNKDAALKKELDDAIEAGATLEDASFQVEGKTDFTQLLEFTSDGDLAGTAGITYRWSGDGGETWTTGTYTPKAAPNNTIDLDGVTLTLPTVGNITTYVPADANAEPPTKESGTALMIRPTAIYNGDTQDRPPETINLNSDPNLVTSATGTFEKDVIVQFDADVDLGVAGNTVSYSYSEDNGATWVKATAKTDVKDKVRLTLPGGYVDVNATAIAATAPSTPDIKANTQIVVHPNRAELGYEVMDDTFITVNSVGKDFFGGVYGDPPVAGDDLKGNLFETVGELIAHCETNNQAGIEASLEKLTVSQEEILTEAARLGGISNRISLAQDILSFQKLTKSERLSYTEDVDLTELLTTMAQQQLAYNTVLKSSATILQMSLTNYM